MNRSTKLNLHLLLLAVVVAADIFIGVRFGTGVESDSLRPVAGVRSGERAAGAA